MYKFISPAQNLLKVVLSQNSYCKCFATHMACPLLMTKALCLVSNAQLVKHLLLQNEQLIQHYLSLLWQYAGLHVAGLKYFSNQSSRMSL